MWVCHSSGMKMTLMTIAKQIRSEAEAYEFMESMRWPNGPICPHCGSVEKHYFLTPKGGTARQTRTGSMTERRVWKCKTCRKQFSVTTGTVFHGSKVPLQVWLMVVYEMCANKNGIAAREIARKYDVAPKTAWFMTQRLREAMKRKAPSSLIEGTVVIDETWIGGEPKNRSKRPKNPGHTKKTPVVSLVDKRTGEVRSRVVADVSGKTLRSVIAENCAMARTILHTDAAHSYEGIAPDLAGHEAVNHSAGEYVRGEVSTNPCETFFSQLKRSIDGTHHHVSREHLHRYVTEFDFRHSTRMLSDAERMTRLFGQVHGRRLAYGA
jgi:transposase-like protein